MTEYIHLLLASYVTTCLNYFCYLTLVNTWNFIIIMKIPSFIRMTMLQERVNSSTTIAAACWTLNTPTKATTAAAVNITVTNDSQANFPQQKTDGKLCKKKTNWMLEICRFSDTSWKFQNLLLLCSCQVFQPTLNLDSTLSLSQRDQRRNSFSLLCRDVLRFYLYIFIYQSFHQLTCILYISCQM